MTTYPGDIIRLFGKTDWQEVIGMTTHNGFPLYELSDGSSVSDLQIEAVLQEESDVGFRADSC